MYYAIVNEISYGDIHKVCTDVMRDGVLSKA